MATLPPTGRPGWRPGPRLLFGIFLLAFLAVLLAVLSVVPVEQSRMLSWGYGGSGSPNTRFEYNSTQSLCPTGASAVVEYSSGVVETNVSISAPSGALIVSENATNWTASFPVLACGSYAFDVVGVGGGSIAFSVTLTYRAPLLLP